MNLKLLSLERKYLEFIRQVRDDPRINKYLFTTVHISKKDQEKWYQKRIKDRKNLVFIFLDEKPVGYGQINNIDYFNRSCEVGFCITPQYQGKGYGGVAVKKLVDYSFMELKMHRVYLETFADNEKALRLYEKYGFEKEGVLRHKIFKDGNFKDVVTMSIIRKEADNRAD